ncbi:MAG: hypothetical protein SCH70_09620 [Candidatus Methanoperedens sp.]|nr:hypothetical protein [Candidatus Methanoperedens sp.]
MIGKITSSNQDTVMVKVRPETGEFFETHNGTVFQTYNIIDRIGQAFHTDSWITRLKIKLSAVAENSEATVTIYDSAQKIKAFCQGDFMIDAGGVQVLHLAFDPLPPGDYYWELLLTSGAIGVGVCTDSTLGGAYKEGVSTADWDIESKLMLAADEQVERAVAFVGDEIDDGVTTIRDGSSLGRLQTGVVEKNISREEDALANGGKILTGSWYVEAED